MEVPIPVKVPLIISMVVASFKGVYWSPTPPPRVEEQKKYGREDIIDRLIRFRVPVAKVSMPLFSHYDRYSVLTRMPYRRV